MIRRTHWPRLWSLVDVRALRTTSVTVRRDLT